MQSLEQQRETFKQNRFLAMPLAGTLAWSCIGVIAIFASIETIIWSIWIGCGTIFYIGIGISKLTGENLLKKRDEKKRV